jgi:hypothetical protein
MPTPSVVVGISLPVFSVTLSRWLWWALPAGLRRSPRRLAALLRRHALSARLAAPEAAATAKRHGCRVFRIGHWRVLAVVSLADRNVYDQLRELVRVAWALA